MARKKTEKTLVLDTEQILKKLRDEGNSNTWLAKKIGCTRQSLHDILMRQTITQAARLGNALGIEPIKLIKTVRRPAK